VKTVFEIATLLSQERRMTPAKQGDETRGASSRQIEILSQKLS
jgi:hypothetical protein